MDILDRLKLRSKEISEPRTSKLVYEIWQQRQELFDQLSEIILKIRNEYLVDLDSSKSSDNQDQNLVIDYVKDYICVNYDGSVEIDEDGNGIFFSFLNAHRNNNGKFYNGEHQISNKISLEIFTVVYEKSYDFGYKFRVLDSETLIKNLDKIKSLNTAIDHLANKYRPYEILGFPLKRNKNRIINFLLKNYPDEMIKSPNGEYDYRKSIQNISESFAFDPKDIIPYAKPHKYQLLENALGSVPTEGRKTRSGKDMTDEQFQEIESAMKSNLG